MEEFAPDASQIFLTKEEGPTFSGYKISCKLIMKNGASITYDIEHYIELFEDKYPVGEYELVDGKFIPIKDGYTEDKRLD